MRRSASIDGCPFAQPGPPVSETGDGFYCRLPGGRVHIPTPDEIRRFCAGGRFTECPVNQRWSRVKPPEPA
jgi:hypothetical protein